MIENDRPPDDGGACDSPSARVEGGYVASEEFHGRHDPIIRAVVDRCRGLPAGSREDGVQEAWLAVLAALPGFVHDATRGRVEHWVAAVARHGAIDLARKLGAHPAEPFDESQADLRPGREADPPSVLLGRERDRQVRIVLEEVRRRVSELAYRVFHAHYVEARPLPAVAAEFGLTLAQAQHHNRNVAAEFRRRAVHLAPPPRPGGGGAASEKSSKSAKKSRPVGPLEENT
jgi:DNA-directed RNA polymerase specialized sigma24 family protein